MIKKCPTARVTAQLSNAGQDSDLENQVLNIKPKPVAERALTRHVGKSVRFYIATHNTIC
eukprot:10563694-Heterocapsa_arctica.AAC.1